MVSTGGLTGDKEPRVVNFYCQQKDKSLLFAVAPHCGPIADPLCVLRVLCWLDLPLDVHTLSFWFWLCWNFAEFVEIIVLTFWLSPLLFAKISTACWQLLPAWCCLQISYICSLIFIQIAIHCSKAEPPGKLPLRQIKLFRLFRVISSPFMIMSIVLSLVCM